MFDWWNAPPNPEQVWVGLKYFQWVRIGIILQLVGGCAVLTELLSQGFKQALSQTADDAVGLLPHMPDVKKALKPYKPISKHVKVLVAVVFYLLGILPTAMIARDYQHPGSHDWHDFLSPVTIIVILSFGVIVGWLLSVISSLLVTFNYYWFVACFGMPLGAARLFAWAININRIKGSMIVIGFVFFFLGTLLVLFFT
jgi:hypothetical protein